MARSHSEHTALWRALGHRTMSGVAGAAGVAATAAAVLALCALCAPAAGAVAGTAAAAGGVTGTELPAGASAAREPGPQPAATGEPPPAPAVEVSPRKVPAGGEVTLRAELCGPGATSARASSVAFTADAELRPGPKGGAPAGTATVSKDAEQGTYSVTVACAGEAGGGEGSFLVAPADDRSPSRHAPRQGRDGDERTQPHGQQQGTPGPDHGPGQDEPGRSGHDESRPAHASPVAPVRAGGGATAGGREGTGVAPGETALALGGGLLFLGAAVLFVRRRTAGPGGPDGG